MTEITGMQFSSLADPSIPHDIKIYSAENFGATHRLLSRPGGYQFGEFIGPEHTSGDVVNGVQHQNLMATSFADNTFDLVLTCDVFEHIPEPYIAHQEIYRILKPGGRHIFSVPSGLNIQLDLQTALVTPQGIDSIAPAEYHGPELDQNLVYNIFGLEMLVELRALGYEPIAWHIDNPELGIIGYGTQVYEAIKKFEPTTRQVPRGRRTQPSPVLNLESAKETGTVGQPSTTAVGSDENKGVLSRCLQSLLSAIRNT